MKKMFNYICAFGVLLLAILLGCKEEKLNNYSVIAAVELQIPVNNSVINLTPFLNTMLNFEWSAAKVGNGTPPFYEIQFDKMTGDFSSPIYKVQTGRLGADKMLSLTHKVLNNIARSAGIEELGTGKVKWRVTATNGIVSSTSEIGILELIRPAGISNIPSDVYIVGTATEAGDDINKALKFKKISEGTFEIYTSLNAGTYKMVDGITGTPSTFIIDGNLITEGASAESPTASKKIYRINLDFNNSSVVLTEITSIGLWFSGHNMIKANLVYGSDGVWKATFDNAFKTESWGKDERYKFRMIEKDELGTLTTVNLGSVKKDNNKPSDNQEASYYSLIPVDNSQYDYTFKFRLESVNTMVELKMQSSGNYTHTVTYK